MDQQLPEIPVILTNSEDTDIFDDDDDGKVPPAAETPENSSPTFLAERINFLWIQMSKDLAEAKFAGVHPTYNAGSKKPEDRLRGLVLIQTLRIMEHCSDHGIFMSYHQLYYFIVSSMKEYKKEVVQLELQMRPNCRLMEKIMMMPRNSLPFFGRPQGFFALGKNVELNIGGEFIGPAGKVFQIPFGDKSVSGLGPFKTNAKLILFVESHSELTNLIEEKVLEQAENTIFMTSCGSADLGFSMVLSKLATDTHLPVRFLVDSDIGGFLIAANLAFGRFSFDYKDRDSFLTPFMKPLGILPAEFLPSDFFMSDLTGAEEKGIQTLKNKWQAHRIELVRDQKFWLDVIRGFDGNKKKMSLVDMRLNRKSDFILNRIVEAEKSCNPAQILKVIKNTNLDIPLSRQSENEPYFT